jgi:hypothetical protein
MMTNEEVPRNLPPYPQGRKPIQPNSRFSSPSPSYNYNYNSNSGYPSQQHLRRKMDNRFKRDTRDNNNGNSSERLMRQNELIIRLLKEIRDRLPPPPVSAQANVADVESARQNGPAEEMERTEAQGQDPQAVSPEPGNQAAAADSAGETLQTGPQVPLEPSRDGD